MKQQLWSTAHVNNQHQMRTYIQPDVVQCPACFRLGAALALPSTPPPTHFPRLGGGFILYIPTLPHISLQIRPGHIQTPHPLKRPPLFLGAVAFCLFYFFFGDAEYVL
jgi:hypothetical protein